MGDGDRDGHKAAYGWLALALAVIAVLIVLVGLAWTGFTLLARYMAHSGLDCVTREELKFDLGFMLAAFSFAASARLVGSAARDSARASFAAIRVYYGIAATAAIVLLKLVLWGYK